MADGVLAIFTADDPGAACTAALRAEVEMRAKHADLNARRSAAGQAVSSIYLGLHIGDEGCAALEAYLARGRQTSQAVGAQ